MGKTPEIYSSLPNGITMIGLHDRVDLLEHRVDIMPEQVQHLVLLQTGNQLPEDFIKKSKWQLVYPGANIQDILLIKGGPGTLLQETSRTIIVKRKLIKHGGEKKLAPVSIGLAKLCKTEDNKTRLLTGYYDTQTGLLKEFQVSISDQEFMESKSTDYFRESTKPASEEMNGVIVTKAMIEAIKEDLPNDGIIFSSSTAQPKVLRCITRNDGVRQDHLGFGMHGDLKKVAGFSIKETGDKYILSYAPQSGKLEHRAWKVSLPKTLKPA